MDKKQYSTKEILFGLRSESIRIKKIHKYQLISLQ